MRVCRVGSSCFLLLLLLLFAPHKSQKFCACKINKKQRQNVNQQNKTSKDDERRAQSTIKTFWFLGDFFICSLRQQRKLQKPWRSVARSGEGARGWRGVRCCVTARARARRADGWTDAWTGRKRKCVMPYVTELLLLSLFFAPLSFVFYTASKVQTIFWLIAWHEIPKNHSNNNNTNSSSILLLYSPGQWNKSQRRTKNKSRQP